MLEASVETVFRRNLKGRVKAEVEAAVAVRVRRIDGFMVGCCVVVLCRWLLEWSIGVELMRLEQVSE